MERFRTKGSLGTIKHILYTKQLRIWGNSCLAGDDYIGRNPLRENSLCQIFFSQKGKWHYFCLVYTWLIHITIMFGLVLSAFFSIKRKRDGNEMIMGRIAVFGFFCFFPYGNAIQDIFSLFYQ